MSEKEIDQLLERISDGKASERDLELFESWYLQFNENNHHGILEADLEQVRNRMRLRLPGNRPNYPLYKRTSFRLIAAILALVLVGSAVYFYQNKNVTITKDADLIKVIVKPGVNEATLTLADGTLIALSDKVQGLLSVQSGVSITKTANGQIVYNLDNQTGSQKESYNTLSTTRGQQFQLNLPDGTKVWLNASSSLKYPVNFKNFSERRVQLMGEGYFEVSKDKQHPFIVESNGQQTKVLGTHFNVNSYQDEPGTKTTLLEGSVKVSLVAESAGAVVLKPGEQAAHIGDVLKVSKVDVEEITAWKNGYFKFNDEKIESIMRKVSRWYNVDVRFEGNISQEEYNGRISRTKNIDEVLDMLGATKTVQFKVEGRRIIVTK